MPKNIPTTPIESLTYQDGRSNIPTSETSSFMEEDEKSPKTVLYPRDPSLDPQLVWRGKDEQDSGDLEVPSVPIYVQEKIHPQALIENLRAESRQEAAETASLFSDFNGIAFEDMIDFYEHEQHWTNRMILGDSLLVMNSLADKERMKGKVQMCYLDPPYGIRFRSNWQVSTRKKEVKDDKIEDITRQPEQVRAFRDTWEVGVHSYLAYLRDRLVVAHQLLTESGSVFIQIGDENVHLVRNVLDEVFGSENYVSIINYTKTSGQTARYLPITTDYILWYAKDANRMKYRPLFTEKSLGGVGAGMYQFVELEDGTKRRLRSEESALPSSLPPKSRPYRLGDVTSQRQGRPSGPGTAMYFPVAVNGKQFYPPGARGWSTTEEGMRRLVLAGRIAPQGDRLSYVRYLDDFPAFELDNSWTDTAGVADRVYVVQTNPEVIKRCLLMTTDPGDLALDPTCGGGTTAFVAEQWGRRWITIDTSRVALALARTRIMAARYPSYLRADTPEGAKKEAEILGRVPSTMVMTGDIRKGFVCKRVSHITVGSIAKTEEIDTVFSQLQPEIDAIRERINTLCGTAWEEWQVPREPLVTWPDEAKNTLDDWWQMRQNRQRQIEVVIGRQAESEVLFDRPYEDTRRVRVAGPFTVESLSPHRVLATDEERPTSEEACENASDGQFEKLVLDNLKRAGVQNTKKGERLTFERLDPYPGACLQAEGEYLENGVAKRVAVALGPEYGTVGPDFIRDAAIEAVQGIGFQTLIVCGFAFDPQISDEAKKYGRLTVLTARMNADLMMGDMVLKKTAAGNLFTIFGEPDIAIEQKDGKIVVDIRGLDIYDPTTGDLRSSSTDDIACWFIDTAYNSQSFFVRHAYFTGADQPYDKLKRALRAEVDEAAWASLYSTTSRPFDPPKSGKIAVKVINHYGDEVMKVYTLSQARQ